MTIDQSTLQALVGTMLGPATIRFDGQRATVDVLDRGVSIDHEPELVRCSTSVAVIRPGDADQAEFDQRLLGLLKAAERNCPDLVRLVYASTSTQIHCYAWLGSERSVADLITTARRCAALSYSAEDLARSAGEAMAVEDELRRLENEVASIRSESEQP